MRLTWRRWKQKKNDSGRGERLGDSLIHYSFIQQIFTEFLLDSRQNLELRIQCEMNLQISLSSEIYISVGVSKQMRRIYVLLERGPGPQRVCSGPASSVWFLTSCRKAFTTRVQVISRGHLLKLETAEHGRAQHSRGSRRAWAGLL